jgi:hypothetical protein
MLIMAEINTTWVKSDQQRELYAKAQALGGDFITLSSEIGARTFVETKDRTPAAGMVISSSSDITIIWI